MDEWFRVCVLEFRVGYGVGLHQKFQRFVNTKHGQKLEDVSSSHQPGVGSCELGIRYYGEEVGDWMLGIEGHRNWGLKFLEASSTLKSLESLKPLKTLNTQNPY